MNKLRYIVFTGIFSVFSLLLVTSAQAVDTYIIDKSHSTIGFAVKHLMVSTTRGEFREYEGVIKFDKDDLSAFTAEVTIQTDSLDTRDGKRDVHLKAEDFFDVEQYPTLTFNNAKLSQKSSGYEIVGDLTIRDVTKTVSIPVDLSGPVVSPFTGNKVIGITGEITINRQDFGISWSKTMDQGGFVVDNNVRIIVEIEGHTSE